MKRRTFFEKSVLSTLATSLFSGYVFADNIPNGYQPLLPFGEKDALKNKHKDLIVLGDKPWNVETPTWLLDDPVTPIDKMFIRNNGLVPETIDIDNWTLTIDGESVKKSKSYTIKELKKKFKEYSYNLVLECGGNGRSGFTPSASGNPWGQGAVHCAKWTGVRLKDILKDVGIKDDAVYIGYYGADLHLSKDPSKDTISRGVPIKKALEDETLIAWAVNDQPIPEFHGAPLRLVVGGWPASVSGKWLKRISIRNKIHDGSKMSGTSYQVPIEPVQPGQEIPVNDKTYRIIESMPVKSLITYPKSGVILSEQKLEVRGQAWAGDLSVSEVHTSIDFGATWQKAILKAPTNRLAWQQWNNLIEFPKKGYYEVWVRATDSNGVSQPMLTPAWNPGGYLNNATERIAVKVE